jgi:DNA helicase IV
MLQHALCLTIYEAKGLEFNDVILFNFFEESPCP